LSATYAKFFAQRKQRINRSQNYQDGQELRLRGEGRYYNSLLETEGLCIL
jgi:hypothetical protein